MSNNAITWAQWLMHMNAAKVTYVDTIGQCGNCEIRDVDRFVVASEEPIPDEIVEKLREAGLMA